MSFARRLVDWFVENRRCLPWREERSGWKVLVSEVMLQQTTAEVVAERFPLFLAQFPGPEALARAAEEEVLHAWSGLGYYRRARALRQAAVAIMDSHGGKVPHSYEQLLRLPGVGAYTAGAVASLAFGGAVPAVDGNVARVASRMFLEAAPIEREAVKARLGAQLFAWREDASPALFNEALIELGALVCRPKTPDCRACPVSTWCGAHNSGVVDEYPKRTPRVPAVPIVSARVLIRRGSDVLLTLRTDVTERLQGFWELPGAWFPEGTEPIAALQDFLRSRGLALEIRRPALACVRHSITHHRIRAELYLAEPQGPIPDVMRYRALEESGGFTTETRKLLGAIQQKVTP